MSADRLKRHVMTVREGYLPVVFCVKCGSTVIDQNSPDELRCYTCQNTMAWDNSLFSINRDVARSGITDAALTDSIHAFRAHGGKT